MKAAGEHRFEEERLGALLELDVLDSEREPIFDTIAELASLICHTPIAPITLIDGRRQCLKAAVGVDAGEMPRKVAFCAHSVLGSAGSGTTCTVRFPLNRVAA